MEDKEILKEQNKSLLGDNRRITNKQIQIMFQMWQAGQRSISKIANKTGVSQQTAREYLPTEKKAKRKYRKTDRYSFQANRYSRPTLKNLKEKGVNMTDWINSAIWWKNLSKKHPEHMLVKMKKENPKLFKHINRKYGKGKSPEERQKFA